MEVSSIAKVFSTAQFRYANEDQLQHGLELALQNAGLRPVREVRLTPRNRIDLMVERIGIEVKVAGTRRDVLAQITRYADSDQVDGLVLVTTNPRHRMPEEINGKPVVVVSLTARGL